MSRVTQRLTQERNSKLRNKASEKRMKLVVIHFADNSFTDNSKLIEGLISAPESFALVQLLSAKLRSRNPPLPMWIPVPKRIGPVNWRVLLPNPRLGPRGRAQENQPSMLNRSRRRYLPGPGRPIRQCCPYLE